MESANSHHFRPTLVKPLLSPPPTIPTFASHPAAVQILDAFATFQQGMNECFNDYRAGLDKIQEQLQESRRLIQERGRLLQELRSKVPTAAPTPRSGPRYAPEDPTLPSPWRGLIDGSTGSLYYWNTESNHTQYERPCPQTLHYPLTLTSADSSVHSIPQPYPTDDSQGIKIPVTHPCPNPQHQSTKLPVNSSQFEAGASIVSASLSSYPATVPSRFTLPSRTKELKLIWAKQTLKPRVHMKMKRKSLPPAARRRQTQNRGDSQLKCYDLPLTALAEADDFVVLGETSPASVPDFQVPVIEDDPQLVESMKLLVSGDLYSAKVMHSNSDGSYHHSHLRNPPHSHTSVETNIAIKVCSVAPTIGSKAAVGVKLVEPGAINRHCSTIDGSVSESDDPCSGSTVVQPITINDEVAEQEFGLGFRICNLGPSEMVLENMWAPWNVHVEFANERNAEELDSTVRDGLELTNAMVVCSADTQSATQLWQWLCLKMCHCEAEKPTVCHGEVFDKMVELFQTPLSQVSTTLNLSFQDTGGDLENITSGMLELYRNCLNNEVGNVKWPPDEFIEKMEQDVNQLLEEWLINTTSDMGIVATLSACVHDKFLCLPITYSLETTSLFHVLMRKSRSIRAGNPLVLLWGSVMDPAIFWITTLTRGRMPKIKFLFGNERLLDSNYIYKPIIHKATVSMECLPKKTSGELSVVMGYHFQQSLILPIIAKEVSADLRKQLDCMLTIPSLLNMFIDESSVSGEPSYQSDLFYLFSSVQYMLHDCSGMDNGCSYSLFKRDIGKLHSQLVAGDVATPELDVLVTHVLNYNCPNDTYEFLHKTSRTDRVVSLTGESKKEIVNWLHDDAKQPWYSRLRANWSRHSSVDSPVMFPLSVLKFSKPAVGIGLRYSYDHPIVLMPTVAIQPVVHPFFDVWLLLIHDHMCCSSRNTSLSMLPYFALGTTARVFKYLSLMLVHMLNHKKETLDVIFSMAIFYVAYASTKIEIATSWILLSTPLFYLTVRVLNLHGWIVIKEYLLLDAAFLITEIGFGNFISILSGAIAIGHVCHIGATLPINSFVHVVLSTMYWLPSRVILQETTDTWGYFQVSFDPALAMVWQTATEAWDSLIMDLGATNQCKADKLMVRDIQGPISPWGCSECEKATKSMIIVPHFECDMDSRVILQLSFKPAVSVASQRTLKFPVSTFFVRLGACGNSRATVIPYLASWPSDLTKGVSILPLFPPSREEIYTSTSSDIISTMAYYSLPLAFVDTTVLTAAASATAKGIAYCKRFGLSPCQFVGRDMATETVFAGNEMKIVHKRSTVKHRVPSKEVHLSLLVLRLTWNLATTFIMLIDMTLSISISRPTFQAPNNAFLTSCTSPEFAYPLTASQFFTKA